MQPLVHVLCRKDELLDPISTTGVVDPPQGPAARQPLLADQYGRQAAQADCINARLHEGSPILGALHIIVHSMVEAIVVCFGLPAQDAGDHPL